MRGMRSGWQGIGPVIALLMGPFRQVIPKNNPFSSILKDLLNFRGPFGAHWCLFSPPAWASLFLAYLSYLSFIPISNFLDLHHTILLFQELISVIISPPITPNKFWGFNKRNSQENDTTLACPY